MFIIHENLVNGSGGSGRGFPMMRRRMLVACFILLVYGFNGLYAQCGFRENGYVFLHPYFNNVNWQATIYQSVIFPAGAMCTAKPSKIAWSRSAAQGRTVYTTAANAWMTTKAPLVDNNCVCCRPTIEFEEPVEIAVPTGLSLQTSLPFHLLSRSAADNDTVYLTAAASGDRVYCLHVNARSGDVGAIDTISITLTGQQAIGGVWGEPDGAGLDTALWIGGSRGLLWLIPFKNNQWGTGRGITIDNSETVSAIGGGYAGTYSGKIYSRSGAAFTIVNSSASSPLRSIGGRIAVGDNGTVLINRDNAWRSYGSGGTNYRYGNLTANAGGTAVELLDDAWNYTTRKLFDSATTISGVSPSEVAASLNGEPYHFGMHGTLTVTIRLRDIDDNREIPSVTLKSGGSATPLNKADDGSTLLRHDPAAVCSTTQAFFNDTLVKLVITPGEMTLEVNAKRGAYDASCNFWKWQSFVFAAKEAWKYSDTLVVNAGGDTLKIINDSQATVTTGASRTEPATATNKISIHRENRRIHFHPGVGSDVRRVVLVDAAGRLIWERTVVASTKNIIVSPGLTSGIHLIIIHYADGRREIRRVVLPGR